MTAGAVLDEPYENFGDVLDAVVDRHADVEAFVDGDDRLTYAEWRRAAAGLAAALAGRGVGTGDVVCLMLPSSVDYAICYAAVLLLGGVVTGVNVRLGPTEVDAILDRCAPRVVIGSGSDRARVPTDFGGLLVAREDLSGHYLAPPLGARPGVDPDMPAVIVWTSGTTGLPKGAWFDHAGLAAAARASGSLSAPFDRRLLASPMAHAAFMTRTWDQLAHVITTVLTPTPWSASSMLDVLVRERITVGQGVPTQWQKLLELPQFAFADLSRLRVVGTGATRVPRELVHDLRQRLSCPVVVRYATTETPAISGTRPGDAVDVLERTVGREQDGVRVRIVDDACCDLPPGEVGRVAVQSPFQMRGYWNDPDQTAAAFGPGGWFASGDLGRFDDGGNLILVGRTSDVYIRGGYNIYPLEVEDALSAHPAVASVAIVGVPAPVIGEIGVAFVVVQPSSRPTVDELRSWCRDRLADYKAPDRIEFIDSLPLTSMMKVDKAHLFGVATQERPADVVRPGPD